jgi:hypothetical protein
MSQISLARQRYSFIPVVANFLLDWGAENAERAAAEGVFITLFHPQTPINLRAILG